MLYSFADTLCCGFEVPDADIAEKRYFHRKLRVVYTNQNTFPMLIRAARQHFILEGLTEVSK